MKPEIRPIDAGQVPERLLLEADPSIDRIREYLDDSDCIGAFLDSDIVGACVVCSESDTASEVMNIAVDPTKHGLGIGTALMRYCIDDLTRRGCERLKVGTGCFGDQLIFYHKLGFRAHSVIRDFFVDNYEVPVVEYGIRHRDMLCLELKLRVR